MTDMSSCPPPLYLSLSLSLSPPLVIRRQSQQRLEGRLETLRAIWTMLPSDAGFQVKRKWISIIPLFIFAAAIFSASMLLVIFWKVFGWELV